MGRRRKGGWMPLAAITVGGNKYLYGGDIRNTKEAMETTRQFYKERGKKVAFRADPTNKKVSISYVSVKKFYPVRVLYMQ